jgi:hypothetical protein
MLTSTPGDKSAASIQKRLTRSRTSSITHALDTHTDKFQEISNKKKRKAIKSEETQSFPDKSLDTCNFSAQLLLSEVEYQRLQELEEIISKNAKSGHFYPLCKLNCLIS